MDIRQLEYVVAVAEEASFTKAARRAHVAQPGISSQIRRLEDELGIELFARTTRRVELTEAGAAVLPSARSALRACEQIRDVAEELTGLRRGHVTVGTMVATSTPRLVELLSSFRRQHPGIDVQLRIERSETLLAALVDGSVDLALVGLSAAPPPGVDFAATLEGALVAVVGAGHLLTAKRRITLAELCANDLIVMADGTGVRSAFDGAARRLGVVPQIAIEASTPDAVADFAAAGFGVGVVPATMATIRPELHVLDIVRPSVRSRIGFAWPRDHSGRPARLAFLDHIARELSP